MEVRGQHVSVASLLPPRGSWRIPSGCLTWWPVHLLTGPPGQACIIHLDNHVPSDSYRCILPTTDHSKLRVWLAKQNFLKTKACSEKPWATYKADPGLPEWPEERGHVSCEILWHRPWHNKTQNALRPKNQETVPSRRVRSLSRGQCSQPGILFYSTDSLPLPERRCSCITLTCSCTSRASRNAKWRMTELRPNTPIQISVLTSLSVPQDAAWCPGGSSSNKRKQEADRWGQANRQGSLPMASLHFAWRSMLMLYWESWPSLEHRNLWGQRSKMSSFRDQSSIPSTHITRLTAACNSKYQKIQTLFWPWHCAYMHKPLECVHTYTCI